MKKIFTIFLLVFIFTSLSFSQNLENRMNKYTQEFGVGYSQPLVEALGLMMNNGWVSVKAMKDLFSVDIGITAVLVPVPSADKQFLIHSPYDGSLQTVPTAVGSSTETLMNSAPPGANPGAFPKGFDLGVIPVIMPQASIGNLLNTRLTIRALPKIKTGDFGYLSLFGLGLQHSISADLLVPTPIDFGIAGSFENLNLGDIASANSYTACAVVSKRVWKINFYSLIGYDYTKTKFDYTTTYYDFATSGNKTTRAMFENEGKNGFKLGIGGSGETHFARFNAGMTFLPKFCFNISMGVGMGISKVF
ncbi:MAG: DUF6588 family protein [Ignavibacteria bacterium]|jgi:hypothetical protein